MKNKIFKILPALMLSVILFSCSKNDLHENKGNADAEKETVVQKESIAQNSLYQVSGEWTNQNGKKISLDQLAGKVQVTAMIFTHCGYACPKMVDNMKAIEEKLPNNLKNKVDFLLISFDARNDTSARLKQYASQKQLDNNWTLLHGSAEQIRMMSMLLQIQYSPLQGGGFTHSNAITILDQHGDISDRIEGLDINVGQLVNAIKEAVARS